MPELCTGTTVPSLIGGRWIEPGGVRLPVENPATGETIADVACARADDVDVAVRAAAAAQPGWAATPLPKRVACMLRLRALLDEHAEELAALITREHGKTLDESRGDVRRGIDVVELCCGAQAQLAGESQQEIASGLDALTWREPIGVCVGITPFNFPAMVPLWMFPVALVCGNAFVLKPSEKVPLTAQRLGELVLEAGIPAGVFSVVNGGREAVEALCSHPQVAAVSFVGSTAVAEAVHRLATHHGKRVQAAGGAKNALVVLPDAEPESTLRAIVGAAFGCAGQRCMAGSLLVAVGDAGDALRRRLAEAIAAIRVGDAGADAAVDVGPLIDAAAKRRVLEGIETGIAEGAELVCDGRRGVPQRGHFVGPTLFDRVTAGSRLARTEWFGPLLAIQRADDLDEAIGRVNAHEYGNGAVLFTADGGAARRFTREVRCGMVGINVGVPAALAPYAFSGWKRSFFGDLHVQGREGFLFYTQQKLVLSRWDGAYRRHMGW